MYPDHPVVGVGTVVFEGDKVLLARRGQEPGLGEWSLPGGAVEVGEGLIEALERELWEELSITIQVGGLIDVLDRIFRDARGRVQYHYVLVDYWGWLRSGRPRPGSDITGMKWVPVGEIETTVMGGALREILLKAVKMRDQSEG